MKNIKCVVDGNYLKPGFTGIEIAKVETIRMDNADVIYDQSGNGPDLKILSAWNEENKKGEPQSPPPESAN